MNLYVCTPPPTPRTHNTDTEYLYNLETKLSDFTFFSFSFLGTMMETSTCRPNFWWKPGRWHGREMFPSFLLTLFPDTTARKTHQQGTESQWPDVLQTRLEAEGFLPESSQCLWNSYTGSILCPSQYSQVPSGSYFCLWQLTSVFSAFS